MTFVRNAIGGVVMTMALLMMNFGAAGFDETKYPDWSGQWKRAPGTVNSWDETKRPGLPQKPLLTPEYQAI